MNNLIIGIAGGSGSGKTTLALRLKERFGEDEVRLISHDSYYKRHDDLPFEERCKLNYDHPDAFDNALLIYHLQELKAGRAIDCPVYDYSNHNRSDKVQHIEPAPVLIVEGILPFVEPELCAMFDYKIFVDTDADERILRRLVRDVKERGWTRRVGPSTAPERKKTPIPTARRGHGSAWGLFPPLPTFPHPTATGVSAPQPPFPLPMP